MLEYYRQREWKICFSFKYQGEPEIWRLLTDSENKELLEIDNEFFSKRLLFQGKEISRLTECRMFSQYRGKNPITYARRIIVPPECKEEAIEIVSVIDSPPQVVSSDDLSKVAIFLNKALNC